ncbi:helix-turn-helix domain-containing protein [Acidocella sp. MX-AZ03]|uniref:helix-turn-helix transcriptional regulator n=1 Tax=Acidocella sp. MX-AZ03 TaxID=2697363 RepID=UPI0022DE421C|nr:helix-turn-helix transcriptional regulator [Acidocella sp. MX-AZ03]WBO58037.1 helix-turn-helix domain-containing protein [Acidocella sp. MX-AZ03]
MAVNIRRLRVERGVSQEAFAVDAGVDRTYMSRIERRLENPTLTVLEKIAAALGWRSRRCSPTPARVAGRRPRCRRGGRGRERNDI